MSNKKSIFNVSNSEFSYCACTKKALTRIAREIGVKGASSLSKAQLVKEIQTRGAIDVTITKEDIISSFRPFFNALDCVASLEENCDAEQNLIKEKILELFGSSLSRLPCLTSKSSPNTKEWLAIQTISMNLELMHDLLGTRPICKPGSPLSYDPRIHEGPSTMEEGDECIALSTGVQGINCIVIKAIVTYNNEK